ncbi:hypothetical protein KJ840_04500 [Patescibacteria group bacterium]|nr:hypothetical protein [Patescibacteria group bacterium]
MMFKLWSALRGIFQKFNLDYLIVFILALVVFSSLQGTFTLPEPDSFYHAKIAKFLSEGQVLHQLPWLQETDLANNFVDHHFLYHLLLVPFVMLDDPLVGVKTATTIFGSLAVLAFYWLLKSFKVVYPFFYIIVLFVSRDWLWRASLVKAPALFLIFLLLAYYFLVKKRWLDLFIISFLAVWLYGGWPMMIALTVFYWLACWLLSRSFAGSWRQKVTPRLCLMKLLHLVVRKKRRRPVTEITEHSQGAGFKNQNLPWAGLAATVGGSVAGLVINPYFPANLHFYWVQIVKIAIINYQEIVRVGNEWYPYSPFNLITIHPLICALLIMGLALVVITFKKQSVHSLTWGLLALALLFLTLKSRRNIEFFIPLTIIFFAFSFNCYLKQFAKEEIKKIFNFKTTCLGVLLSIFVLTFLFQAPRDILAVKKDMLVGFPINHYQEAAQWLRQNTPKHSVVFHSDWDDFPFLFYYNDHNYYLTGLDHTFMYEKDQEKYWLYENIISGKEQEDLAKKIKENFNADYVFVEKSFVKLESNLSSSDSFKQVYEDKKTKIYQIINND